MAHADAIAPVRRGREERLFLTTFSFGHFANDWTAGSILLLTPAIAVGMDLTPARVGVLAVAASAIAYFLPFRRAV